MENKKNYRNKIMGVRYNPEDFNRLKAKAESEGLDVSTYCRHVSLKSLK